MVRDLSSAVGPSGFGDVDLEGIRKRWEIRFGEGCTMMLVFCVDVDGGR